MKFLFTSGTARGGTNFRTLLLNNHPKVQMSIDPFIPLFRFYRDSLLKSTGNGLIAQSSILDDYYFSIDKIKVMKEIQNANPDIAFDLSQWNSLKSVIESRMKLASENLIPYLDKLPAPTFKEVFFNTREVILAASKKDIGEIQWVGFNDNWTVEFFPLIAKLFPEAKFILHLRDPRAVVYSSEFAEPDPAKHPTVVSFARHLRKYASFAIMHKNNALLKDRLLVTNYEPFIANPELEIRKICSFLEIEYLPEIININAFKKANGKQWESDWNTYQVTESIWREKMPREMLELTEFICDPEMRLHGYIPELYDNRKGLSGLAVDYAIKNIQECKGWNTDFPEIERTLGSEFYRKKMLNSSMNYSNDEIERCFLFQDVLQLVKQLPID